MASGPICFTRSRPTAARFGPFRHGVASGDPLTDRVILWTRVTPDESSSTADRRRWRIATDPSMDTDCCARQRSSRVRTRFHGQGRRRRSAARPHLLLRVRRRRRAVAVGRTKTLPAARRRARASGVGVLLELPCRLLQRLPLRRQPRRPRRGGAPRRLHLRVRERQSTATAAGCSAIPVPRREAVTLSDYRIRYATYRTDPDLQDAHRQHPFIAVWDDHELTNDAWSGGAANHNPEQGEGDWADAPGRGLPRVPRMDAGTRVGATAASTCIAASDSARLWISIMLDTRGLRDQQVRDDLDGARRSEAVRCSAPRRKRGSSTSCERRSAPARHGGCSASRCCSRA